MRIGSLCSGYGGLDMALGGDVVWHCENDPHASKVLAHHWPRVPNLGDLKAVDWSSVEPVDWLTAGYPCQPFSAAGKRQGVEDPRHIWPSIAEGISCLRPRYIVLENVRGHLSLGFDVVLGSLTRLGYDVRWGVVRASDAGAAHQRARLFILAHAHGERVDGSGLEWARGRQELAHRGDAVADADRDGSQGAQATSGSGQGWSAEDGRGQRSDGCDWGAYGPAIERWGAVLERMAPSPTEPGRNRPRLAAPFVEWMMGLPEGHVTGVPGLSRTNQLEILGNGVVPQQAVLALRMLHG